MNLIWSVTYVNSLHFLIKFEKVSSKIKALGELSGGDRPMTKPNLMG